MTPATATVVAYCRQRGYPQPTPEHRFCERRWRFDLAFVDRRLAVEFEGGVWIGGRHTRGAGYERDLEKYSRAALLGWRLLRATPGMVERGTVFAWLDEEFGTK